jgi:hypothetical protein
MLGGRSHREEHQGTGVTGRIHPTLAKVYYLGLSGDAAQLCTFRQAGWAPWPVGLIKEHVGTQSAWSAGFR